MEDYIKLRTTREALDGILARHKGKDFAQCGKCGSMKSNTKELVKTLTIIESEGLDSEDELFQGMGEFCGDLLRRVIEVGLPEECYRNSEFCIKWLKENDKRNLPELSHNFGDEVFIKSQDVVLKVDDKCGCFEKIIISKEKDNEG